jgi:hypothetical protein
LKARELFYNTGAGGTPAPPSPAKPQAQAKPQTQAKATSKRPPKPASSTTAAPATELAKNAPSPHPVDSSPPAAAASSVVPVSFHPTPDSPPAPALGLKYTVVKIVDNQQVEVSPDTVFHAGDRVRFSIEPNGPGYLYIVQQGSSGTWQPVFPSADIADSSNRVDGWRTYMMPPKSRLVFDQQTGTEKIFIVLSRVEVPDLERLMYSLKTGAKPASDESPQTPTPKTLVAGLTIDDATVGRLRNAFARDLVIEKVDEGTPGPAKEKAVYVVNPTGSSDSRVVADIQLVHQ